MRASFAADILVHINKNEIYIGPEAFIVSG